MPPSCAQATSCVILACQYAHARAKTSIHTHSFWYKYSYICIYCTCLACARVSKTLLSQKQRFCDASSWRSIQTRHTVKAGRSAKARVVDQDAVHIRVVVGRVERLLQVRRADLHKTGTVKHMNRRSVHAAQAGLRKAAWAQPEGCIAWGSCAPDTSRTSYLMPSASQAFCVHSEYFLAATSPVARKLTSVGCTPLAFSSATSARISSRNTAAISSALTFTAGSPMLFRCSASSFDRGPSVISRFATYFLYGTYPTKFLRILICSNPSGFTEYLKTPAQRIFVCAVFPHLSAFTLADAAWLSPRRTIMPRRSLAARPRRPQPRERGYCTLQGPEPASGAARIKFLSKAHDACKNNSLPGYTLRKCTVSPGRCHTRRALTVFWCSEGALGPGQRPSRLLWQPLPCSRLKP